MAAVSSVPPTAAEGPADGGDRSSRVGRWARGAIGLLMAGGAILCAAAAGRPPDDIPTAGDPVDVATGDVILSQTDLTLAGLLPLVVERMHRSSWRAGRWFGRSWASTFDQRLRVGSERVIGVFGDGRALIWPLAGTGAFGGVGGGAVRDFRDFCGCCAFGSGGVVKGCHRGPIGVTGHSDLLA